MKKIFLKLVFFFLCGLSVTLFYSCEKGDDSDDQSTLTIEANDLDSGSDTISYVKYLAYDLDNVEENYSLCEADCNNNSFTLGLSTSVPSAYLSDLSVSSYYLDSISISDSNAQIYASGIVSAYSSSDEETGYFYYEALGYSSSGYLQSMSEAIWAYVDRNVNVKGTYTLESSYTTYILNYNLNLKKGWNVFYLGVDYNYDSSTGVSTYTYSYLSNKPSATFAWYYESEAYTTVSTLSTTSLKTKAAIPVLFPIAYKE